MKKIKSNKRGIIFYELNEVPRKLLEKYIELKPKSTIARIINNSKLFDTHTNDIGELHPWTTWPTVHRGINNDKHNIQFINQELKINDKYPPIWDILQKNGISVGIYGSLQSYPPIKSEFIKFFLPDTFSPDCKAFPKELEEFQKFNLSICKDNKAVSNPIKANLYLSFLNLFISKTISLNSFLKTFKHITSELLYSKYKSRRSLLQPILNFDLFVKYLIQEKPMFSTYFTNHVAGMMHRYWIYLFDDEMKNKNKNPNNFHRISLIKSMDIVDNQLKRLLKISEELNYNIIVTSSMGQKTREKISSKNDICLNNLKKFCKIIGLNPNQYVELPAMQPDICIKCSNKEALKSLRSNIKKVKDLNNENIIMERYKPLDLNLNITILVKDRFFDQKKIKINNSKINIEESGFKIVSRDPGTAYHCPEGSLFTNGDKEISNLLNDLSKPTIDTSKLAPTILDYFGVEIPSYMKS